MALSGIGLDSVRIEGLARWRSPMLLHYAKLAPQEYRRRAHESDVLHGTRQPDIKIAALESTMARVTERLDRDDAGEVEVGPANRGLDLFVKNFDSNKWHLSVVHEIANATGITECKWCYTRHNSITSGVEPTGIGVLVCNRCLPRLAAKARGQVAGSSSSSSSSST